MDILGGYDQIFLFFVDLFRLILRAFSYGLIMGKYSIKPFTSSISGFLSKKVFVFQPVQTVYIIRVRLSDIFPSAAANFNAAPTLVLLKANKRILLSRKLWTTSTVPSVELVDNNEFKILKGLVQDTVYRIGDEFFSIID